MSISTQIAKHLHDLHFGGNWTVSDLKSNLQGLNWEQATQQVGSLNSIAALVYHINYYVVAISRVMEGRPIDAKDELSYQHPPVNDEADWEALKAASFSDAEKLVALIREFPDERLSEIFVHEKYGTWYRNLHGVTEHAHYHLGQIAVIKKLILQGFANQK